MASAAAARNSERLRVGIVLARRRIAHPWQEFTWRGAAVIPGARDIAAPILLAEGEGTQHYHVATLDIEVFPSETEGYRYNLSQDRPAVYALWRNESGDPAALPELFHVTVCPYEAQDYQDGADVVVEGIEMPDVVSHWLRSYVARYHVEEPFEKRRQKPHAAVEEDEIG